MGKSSGATRSSSSNAPRGLEQGYNPQELSSKILRQEEMAERWYRNGALTVDPGDAVFEQARNLLPSQVGDSIDNLTNYSAMANTDYAGKVADITIIPNNFSPGELVRDYGADLFRISTEDRSLVDIIDELRTIGLSKLFAKYK